MCIDADSHSACIASAIALAYRILQEENKADANWLLGPLGVAVYDISTTRLILLT